MNLVIMSGNLSRPDQLDNANKHFSVVLELSKISMMAVVVLVSYSSSHVVLSYST